MSIDTPRTVKSKGEFVRKYGLGGLFTWTIDMDNGLLVNAAREGLNAQLQNQVIDMSSFYFKGINAENTPDPLIPRITGQLQVNIGDTIHLSGETSTGAQGFLWEAPGLAFDKQTTPRVEAIADTAGIFPVTLTINDNAGQTANTSVNILITNEKPVARITGDNQVNKGSSFTLSGKESTNAVGYYWEAADFSFNGSHSPTVQAIADKNGHFPVKLTVTSSTGDTADAQITMIVKDEEIPKWEPKAYPTPNTKVRNNYNNQGEHIYINHWYAEAFQEPGNPDFTGPSGSGKVWSLVE